MALINRRNTKYAKKRKREVIRRLKRIFSVLLLAVLFLTTGLLHPTLAYKVANNSTVQRVTDAQNLVERGRKLYAAERFAEAAAIWQQAISAFKVSGDRLSSAMTLGNLSLTYQKLGQWNQAQSAIDESFNLLGYNLENNSSIKNPQIFAQILDIQGKLKLSLSKPQDALNTWQQAANIYQKIGDKNAVIRNQINQAQAMQVLGFYGRASKMLKEANKILDTQPDTVLKVTLLRSLGNATLVTGDLDDSRRILWKSLDIAKSLQDKQTIGDILISLGNVARAQDDTQTAINYYQQASEVATSPTIQIQALVNQFSLLVDTNQLKNIQSLSSQIQTQLSQLPLSSTAIFAQINFAQSLIELENNNYKISNKQNLKPQSQNYYHTAAEILAVSTKQAENLKDKRTQSYALGVLGKIYEQTQQWDEAQKLTKKALFLAQSISAEDITYKWQWQLARLAKIKGNIEDSLLYYDQAVNSLQSIRYDLFAVNSGVKFSFQEDIEPIYRQRVDLLLKSNNKSQPSESNLTKATRTIELLQIAQLNNFFRNTCLDSRLVKKIENPQSVVIYPFIFSDRLSVIVNLPQQKSLYYSTTISKDKIQKTLSQLQEDLPKPHTLRNIQKKSKEVYKWLIQPQLEAALAKIDNPTLVFVLDGALRNIPPAVLYDGKQYLIEKYNIALTPSQQLVEAKPLQKDLKAIAAGLTEPSGGFSALPNVKQELDKIREVIPSSILLNSEFTSTALQNKINSLPYPVVHLATHGKFSSKAEDTFIVAWNNERIYVKDLNKIVQTVEQNKPEAIELLVLSACQTATGDEEAALGIAGVAFQAGARSTIASLWNLDDESTSELMGRFYQEFANKDLTKAQALRNAQLSLLRSRKYKRPRYWAPYILLGNWL